MADNRATTRADDAQASQPANAAPGIREGISGIGGKMSGVVNIIHGTGEIIRGQAMDSGKRGHSNGKVIAAAGRDEVHRGLAKLEGNPTTTSTAAGAAPGLNQRGVDGAASGPAPTAPQAPATAPRSDPTTTGQARGDAGATGYPPEKQTAAEGDTRSRRPEQYDNEQNATTAAPRGHPAAADGSSVQRDTDVTQQRFEKRSAGDEQTGNASQRPGNVARQEEYDGTAAPSQPSGHGYEVRS